MVFYERNKEQEINLLLYKKKAVNSKLDAVKIIAIGKNPVGNLFRNVAVLGKKLAKVTSYYLNANGMRYDSALCTWHGGSQV